MVLLTDEKIAPFVNREANLRSETSGWAKAEGEGTLVY